MPEMVALWPPAIDVSHLQQRPRPMWKVMRVAVWLVVQVTLFQFVASVALLFRFASRIASALQVYLRGKSKVVSDIPPPKK